jgi:glycerol kinase
LEAEAAAAAAAATAATATMTDIHTNIPVATEPIAVNEFDTTLQKIFLGSIDQGTTSSRFLIFDKTGTPVAAHQIEFEQMYPQSGYVFFFFFFPYTTFS